MPKRIENFKVSKENFIRKQLLLREFQRKARKRKDVWLRNCRSDVWWLYITLAADPVEDLWKNYFRLSQKKFEELCNELRPYISSNFLSPNHRTFLAEKYPFLTRHKPITWASRLTFSQLFLILHYYWFSTIAMLCLKIDFPLNEPAPVQPASYNQTLSYTRCESPFDLWSRSRNTANAHGKWSAVAWKQKHNVCHVFHVLITWLAVLWFNNATYDRVNLTVIFLRWRVHSELQTIPKSTQILI